MRALVSLIVMVVLGGAVLSGCSPGDEATDATRKALEGLPDTWEAALTEAGGVEGATQQMLQGLQDAWSQSRRQDLAGADRLVRLARLVQLRADVASDTVKAKLEVASGLLQDLSSRVRSGSPIQLVDLYVPYRQTNLALAHFHLEQAQAAARAGIDAHGELGAASRFLTTAAGYVPEAAEEAVDSLATEARKLAAALGEETRPTMQEVGAQIEALRRGLADAERSASQPPA